MKKYVVILVVISLCLVVLGAYGLSKSRTHQLFGEIVSRVETEKKMIALTFDDGPGDNTQDLIEVLDQLDIPATFYLIGSEIQSNQEFGKALVEAGHEIGNHSYSHERMVLTSLSTVEDEIEKTNQAIRNIGYEGNITFRPPYCKKLIILPYYLNQKDMTTVTWDIEPETDLGFQANAETYYQLVIDQASPGSIILFHGMRDSNEEVIASIRKIVADLQGQGYQFVTVSNLIASNE